MAKAATAGTASKRTNNLNAPRVAPVLSAVSNAVPMPDRPNTRGSKTNYPFAALTAVGMSFGVMNKTAANLASIISNQNRKPGATVKNPDGTVKYKMKDMLDANGAVIGQVPDTNAPETLPQKHFFAFDTDPKTDPDKASVRVFRDA